MRKIILSVIVAMVAISASAQEAADTVSSGDLEDVMVVSRRRPNYVSGLTTIKTEVTTKGGLAKMACCTVAESFENSASVTVGYSDAISGAKQIRMLGLSGVYTQMLDESRPTMRGLVSPLGLSYVPGSWLNSIQVSKGISSVVSGPEAITGQINVEPRKPTDMERLFINAYFDQDMMGELNITSAIPLTDRLSTVIMVHGSYNDKRIDHNGDGFMDSPLVGQINLSNRWLYIAPSGVQIRAGVQFLSERRRGGQMDFNFDDPQYDNNKMRYWGSESKNRLFNGYVKVAVPVGENGSNLAFVADYVNYNQQAYYGATEDMTSTRPYSGKQHSFSLSALYYWNIAEKHKLTLGVSATGDRIREKYQINEVWETPYPGGIFDRGNSFSGVFAEYTANIGERITAVVGMRADMTSVGNALDKKENSTPSQANERLLLTPRFHLKWDITDDLIFRGSAGMGYRAAQPFSDNPSVMPLSMNNHYSIWGGFTNVIEEAFTYGGSLTQSFRLGTDHSASISLDVFRSRLINHLYLEQVNNLILAYNTQGETTTYQIDFSWSPFERFDVLATFRYNDSHVWNVNGEKVEKPLIDNFKGLLNLQYATKFRKWVFDFTAQLNGRSKLPTVHGMEMDYSPVYPMFYAQITRKFKGIDLYLGCENIGNYTQHNPIIGAANPFGNDFNPSVIWGPLMGRKFYAGLRFTISSY